jgi:hypothetical protein
MVLIKEGMSDICVYISQDPNEICFLCKKHTLNKKCYMNNIQYKLKLVLCNECVLYLRHKIYEIKKVDKEENNYDYNKYKCSCCKFIIDDIYIVDPFPIDDEIENHFGREYKTIYKDFKYCKKCVKNIFTLYTKDYKDDKDDKDDKCVDCSSPFKKHEYYLNYKNKYSLNDKNKTCLNCIGRYSQTFYCYSCCQNKPMDNNNFGSCYNSNNNMYEHKTCGGGGVDEEYEFNIIHHYVEMKKINKFNVCTFCINKYYCSQCKNFSDIFNTIHEISNETYIYNKKKNICSKCIHANYIKLLNDPVIYNINNMLNNYLCQDVNNIILDYFKK